MKERGESHSHCVFHHRRREQGNRCVGYNFCRQDGSSEHFARARAEDDLFVVAVIIVTVQGQDALEGRAVPSDAVSIIHLLVLFSSGATAFILLEHIRETGWVVVSALQSLPVAAIASALVVSGLSITVAGRFDVVGSRSGERCHGFSAASGSARNWGRRHTHTVAGSKLTLTGDVGCGVILFGRNVTDILIGATARVAVDDGTALSVAAYNTMLVNLVLGALGGVRFVRGTRAQIMSAMDCLSDRSDGACGTASRRSMEVHLARRLLVKELGLVAGCTYGGGVTRLDNRASGSDIGRKR
jgi:hypothetical protein